ncbi:MAG: D-alanyl-D-alanine carboxypeptidase/D-alanyl-D-alanine-endopeptidase, partial [Gemmatimonadaceae bacterium]|nr:D-alanyl-D-alanine carboxypeptidase/D-alanyl-D-alanine-endopeptidase [Gemmatimonadaceae bacterium]
GPSGRRIGSAAPAWREVAGVAPLVATVGETVDRFAPRRGTYGLLVVSLDRGDTLFARQHTAPLLPASTMKLFTAALGFDRLGPEWQFKTEIFRDGPLLADGTVRGNLYVRGDGDPSLSNRLLGGPPGIGATLLAAKISAAGVKRVTGSLIGDATAFDAKGIPDGWRSRYLGAAYAARVSALSINENLVWVGVRPGSGPIAEAFLEPASTTMTVTSAVKVVAGRRARIRVVKTRSGYEVRGTIGKQAGTRRYEYVLEDPATFTAGAVAAALKDAAIPIEGGVRLGAVPAGSQLVTSLASPSLASIVHEMNGESINHFAELVFRASARGKERVGVGSAEAGNAALQTFLTKRVGLAANDVYAADGSGLSILDRSTPRALVKLLEYAHKAPWREPFLESLPVAGQRETLRFRMRGTPAQGNLRAKTGTTNEVTSLAGYVTTRDGETLAFAAVYNGNDRWRARALTDALGATLAAWRRTPLSGETDD